MQCSYGLLTWAFQDLGEVGGSPAGKMLGTIVASSVMLMATQNTRASLFRMATKVHCPRIS